MIVRSSCGLAISSREWLLALQTVSIILLVVMVIIAPMYSTESKTAFHPKPDVRYPNAALASPLTFSSKVTTTVRDPLGSVVGSSIPLGNEIHASAILEGVSANAGGTVTYTLFRNPSCFEGYPLGAPEKLMIRSVAVTNGIVPNSFSTPLDASFPFVGSTLSFASLYSGDDRNSGAFSPCVPFSVIKATPTLTTLLSADTISAGGSVSDTATLNNFAPEPHPLLAMLNFNLFLSGDCSGPPTHVSEIPVPAATSGPFRSQGSVSFPSGGLFSWQAAYKGDDRNNAVTSDCEPLRVTGQEVSLTTRFEDSSGRVVDHVTIGETIHDTASLELISAVKGSPPGFVSSGGTVTYTLFSGSTCTTLISDPFLGPPVNVVRRETVSVTNGLVPDSSPFSFLDFQPPSPYSVIFPSGYFFSWSATFSGDSQDNGAFSICEPFAFLKATPTLTTVLSADTIAAGDSVHDAATLSNFQVQSSPFPALASIGFKVFSAGTCSGPLATNVAGLGRAGTVSLPSDSVMFPSGGLFSWQAFYEGDALNNAVSSNCELLTVTGQEVSLTTGLLDSLGSVGPRFGQTYEVPVGLQIRDSAKLAGVSADAAGSVTYSLFSDDSCFDDQSPLFPSVHRIVYKSTVTVTNGVVPDSRSTSVPDFAFGSSYSWNAVYSGDLNNNGAFSACEPFTVVKNTPTVTTTLSATTVTAGSSVSDSASLLNMYSGPCATNTCRPALETLDYNLFSSSDCSGSATRISTDEVGFAGSGVPSSSQVRFHASSKITFPAAGSFSWNTVYYGDALNTKRTGGCDLLIVTPPPVDISPPTLTVPGDIVVNTDLGLPTAVVTFSVTATDDVAVASITCLPSSGTAFTVGSTTVTCVATDTSGNSSTASFQVTVVDKEAPSITVSADITVSTDPGRSFATVVYPTPSATDNVGLASVSCSPSVGAAFPIGTTTVACIATDTSGNSALASFLVMVIDVEPPKIIAPSTITAEATGPEGAVVYYARAAATDNSGSVSVTCGPPDPGSTFPLGTTTVSCSATDFSGNTATVSFTVRVVDTTPPALSLSGLPVTLEASGPKGAVGIFSASATDLVSGSLTAICSPLSGSTFPMGVTKIACTATDAAGNTSSIFSTVTVQDTTPPFLTLPADITAQATGPSGAQVTYSIAATDMVDGSVPTVCLPASTSTFPLGTSIVVCSATDASGNRASSSFHVNVYDFTISVTPSDQTVLRGGSTSYNVKMSLSPGSTGAPPSISLKLAGPPADSTTSSLPSSISLPGTATFNIQAGAVSLGDFLLTVTGGSRSGSALLHIYNFAVSVSPSAQAIDQGGVASYTVTMILATSSSSMGIPLAGLAVRSCPTGATCTFTPASATPTFSSSTSTFNIKTTTATLPGTYTFAVTGTDSRSPEGGMRVSPLVSLTVLPPIVRITTNTTLTTDLKARIVVGADRLLLNCAGHTISGVTTDTGSVSNVGVSLNGRKAVLVENCRVSNFSIGFQVVSSSYVALKSNAATGNKYGFLISSSPYVGLVVNNATGNTADGFRLESSSYNALVGNNARDNLGSGFVLVSSSNNYLWSNTSNNNGKYGFALTSSSNNNQLLYNTATLNGIFDAFKDSSSINNVLRNNTFGKTSGI